jgi:hypothetical protein
MHWRSNAAQLDINPEVFFPQSVTAGDHLAARLMERLFLRQIDTIHSSVNKGTIAIRFGR